MEFSSETAASVYSPPALWQVPIKSQSRASPGGFFSSVDRKSTRLNSSHANISYAVFCLKKKKKNNCLDLGPRNGQSEYHAARGHSSASRTHYRSHSVRIEARACRRRARARGRVTLKTV